MSPPSPPQLKNDTAVIDKLQEISDILNTGLHRDTIVAIKALCEHGVNPQALAQVLKYLSREAAADTSSSSAAAHAAPPVPASAPRKPQS